MSTKVGGLSLSHIAKGDDGGHRILTSTGPLSLPLASLYLAALAWEVVKEDLLSALASRGTSASGYCTTLGRGEGRSTRSLSKRFSYCNSMETITKN